MSAKFKKIIFPIIIIAVCLAAVATVLAVTLTRKDENKHIVIDDSPRDDGGKARGELDISLMREKLETKTLDGRGIPVINRTEKLTDFSNSAENIFGVGENTLIGPTCYFKADMAIANKKPYAFEYWLEIMPEYGENLLTDQLELTVEIDGETFIKRTLSDGLSTKVFPKTEIGKTSKFSIKLEYLDVQNNNDTKNATLAFDMAVHARLAES